MTINECLAEAVEVRPGRFLFCRHCNVSSECQAEQSMILVCLHGTAANHAQFLPFVRALEVLVLSGNQAINIHCWMYDAVGCGNSPAIYDTAAYSDVEQVQDLMSLVQMVAQTENQPLFILGHSYAPNWIYKFILQQEENLSMQQIKLSGIIIVSSGLYNPKYQMQKGGPALFRSPLWLLKCLQPILTKIFLRLGFARVTHSEKPQLIQDAKSANNRNDMNIVRQYYQAHDWLQDLADVQKYYYERRICRPPLILHGIQDEVIPILCGQDLANRWNVPLISVPDASHMVFLEQPTIVAGHVFEYMFSPSLR